MKRAWVRGCILAAFASVIWPSAGNAEPEAPSDVVVTETPTAIVGIDDDRGRVELAQAEASPLATDEQRAYLGQWLEYTAAATLRARRASGITGIVGGSFIMGIGVAFYVGSSSNVSDADRGFGLAFIGAASISLSVGIFQLARKSPAEKRLLRWQRVNLGTLTLRELGQFEGELRAQADLADRGVRFSRWTNFGIAMGGALMLALTPATGLSRDDRELGYVVGGVTMGVGLLGFALSFITAPETKYWDAYQAGQPPPTARRWRATPAVSRRFVGAKVEAVF